MAAEQTAPETKSERVALAVTPTERWALEFVAALYPEQYDGASTVLRDYSLRQAVQRASEASKRLESIGAA